MHDSYGVREALFEALRDEVAELPAIPGIGAPYEWHRIVSLQAARRVPNGVVILSCFSRPLLVAPIAAVACDPVVLLQLARELAAYDPIQPDVIEHAVSECYRIPIGERVIGMRVGEQKSGRYDGTLWIAPHLIAHGLSVQIERVLAGQAPRISSQADPA